MRRFVDPLAADLVFALRTCRRSPAFTLAALLALALGIGASVAVFSMVDRVLFRALPYRSADRLVSLGMLARVVEGGEFLFAADYRDLRESQTPFASLASWSGVRDCDLAHGFAVRARCASIDEDFLPVLGVKPLLGANFEPSDTRVGAPRRILLSYGIWQSRFGGDPRVVGSTLLLDGAQARIAGVLPPEFELPTLEHADLLEPEIIQPAGWQHGSTFVLRVVARLRAGVSLAGARAQLSPAFARMLSFVPPPFRKEVQFRVRSIRDRQMEDVERISWTLLAAALAVLLIACANVSNLLLAGLSRRRAELAIRAALGAGRGRLIQQLAVESLTLAAAGGALGCALAWALLKALVAAAPHRLPHLADASLDGRVLLFALLASLAAGLVFGIAPAFERPRMQVLGSARTASPRSSRFVKSALVAGQLALSTVLVTSAGLLVRSLWNLETQSLGMQPARVITAQLVLPIHRYTKPAERVAFFNEVERQVAGVWGIRALGLSDSLPPGGWERSRPLVSIAPAEFQTHEGGSGGLVTWRYVSPGYFEALQIPVVEGHPFTEAERARNANVCLLSRSLARRLFPGGSAIGRRLKSGAEILGVVPDVRNSGLASAEAPEYYMLRGRTPDDTYLNSTGPVAQRTLSLVMRSSLTEAALVNAVRAKIARLDPALPVEFATMHRRLQDLAEGPRFNAWLLGAFACAGLLLAGIGLYGTVAHLATQRTREIGIRMSLGATPRNIAVLVGTSVLRWTATGTAAGLLASLLVTHFLSSLLFRVPAADPLTLAASLSFLIAVSFAAALGPVRVAAQTDPVRALRQE